MESLLAEMVKQVPGIAAVIIVNIIYLRFMKVMMKMQQDYFDKLHSEHLDERVIARRATEQTAIAMQQNVIETQRNTLTLQRLTETIEKKL